MDNKVMIITGAASGIGRATAIEFAQKGGKTVVSDVQEEKGQAVVEEIQANGGDAFFIKCDVSKEEEVKALVEQTVAHYGRLDYAFNNAGVGGEMAAAGEYPTESWDWVMGVNLKGVYLCMKYEIPEMLKAGGGSIVNCASILGRVGFQMASAYVASKHGVLGLTKTAALEYARQGIRVNAVCPGFIHTPMIEGPVLENEEMKAFIENAEPIGRVGKPEEVASAVLWLCSEGAGFVTGESLMVDGGWIAQ